MLGGFCLNSFSLEVFFGSNDFIEFDPTGALLAVDGSSEDGWEWLSRVNKVSEPLLFELLRGGGGGIDRPEAVDDRLA
jgi:hypothetical protein